MRCLRKSASSPSTNIFEINDNNAKNYEAMMVTSLYLTLPVCQGTKSKDFTPTITFHLHSKSIR